ERLRGHGALLGAMDTTVHVEKLSDDVRSASVIKANDSEEGERVTFSLESVLIGPETTAPAVIPGRNCKSEQATLRARQIGIGCDGRSRAFAWTIGANRIAAPERSANCDTGSMAGRAIQQERSRPRSGKPANRF